MAASLPPELVTSIRLGHPAPVAEAVFAMETADSLHEQRDRVVEVFRTALRLMSTIAVAARLQRGPGAAEDAPRVREIFQQLRQRGLTDGQWLEITRELLRPWAANPVGHPLPALVDLVHGRHRKRFAENTNGLLEMRKSETVAHGKTGDEADVTAFLDTRVPQLVWLLERLDEIWKTVRLVVPLSRPDVPEDRQRAFDITGTRVGSKWLRRDLAAGIRVPPGEPLFADLEGKPVLALSPAALWHRPSPESAEELFVLEGGDKKGAVFRSYPACSEHCLPAVWSVLERALGTGESGADNAPKVAGETRPFRGLESFERRHAALFFGREREAQALANRIRRRPVVTVTGPSGAGKSSLLQAGVLPHLAEFEVVALRPGAQPLASLAYALEALRAWPDLDAALAHFKEKPSGLGELLLSWTAWRRREARSDEPRLLLIVDQAEELFTLCSDSATRAAFGEALASVAANEQWPTRLVLSIRGDFVTRLSDIPALRDLYSQEVEIVSRPDAEALARTLIAPASLYGYKFEDQRLVDSIVQSVLDAPSALPLLQFCADRLWEQRDRAYKQLTWNAYQAMNGVAGAIADHAERTYSNLTADQQAVARQVLVRLVTEERTRQVVPKEVLRANLPDPAIADATIDALIRARLLTVREKSGRETPVELVHEAVLTQWPRFRKWLDEDLSAILMHSRLTAATRRWEEEGRNTGLLLREGRELGEAEDLEATIPSTLSDGERSLIDASRKAVRHRRALRRGVIAGLGALVCIIGTMAFVVLQKSKEEHALGQQITECSREDATNLAMRAAAAAHERLWSDTAMFAAAALQEAPDPSARGWMLSALSAWTPRLERQVNAGRGCASLAVSPDGSQLACASYQRVLQLSVTDGTQTNEIPFPAGWVRAVAWSPSGIVALGGDGPTVRLWDQKSGQVLRDVTVKDPISSLAFISGGSALALGDRSGRITVLSVPEGRPLHEWQVAGTTVTSVSPSSDNTLLAAGFSDGHIRVWHLDAQDGGAQGDAPPVDLAAHEGAVATVSFAPTGVLLASGGWDRTLRLWNPAEAKQLEVREDFDATLQAVAFSRDGRLIAVAGASGLLQIFDVTTMQRVARQSGFPARSLSFTGNRRLVVGTEDGPARIWDLSEASLPDHVRESARPISAVGFGAGGTVAMLDSSGRLRAWQLQGTGGLPAVDREIPGAQSLALGTDDGTLAVGDDSGHIRLWSARTGPAGQNVAAHDGKVLALALSGDGNTLVSGGADRQVKVWNVRSGPDAVRTLEGHTGGVNAVAVDRNARAILSGSQDRTVRVWDPAGHELRQFRGNDGPVLSVAIVPDGTLAASGDANRGLRLWDPGTAAQIASLEGHEGAVLSVAFSADGQWLASGSSDHTVRLWSVPRRALIATLAEPEGDVLSVAFSPDGRWLASGGWDRTMRLWDVGLVGKPDHDMLDLVRDRFGVRFQGQRIEPDKSWSQRRQAVSAAQ
jgi:WD40 repeat protein